MQFNSSKAVWFVKQHIKYVQHINPNKAGLFEGSFSWKNADIICYKLILLVSL